MNPWTKGRPTSFNELFEFYHDYVKLLYSEVQTQNVLPDETLFEMNAAFDHVSTRWSEGEPEQKVVDAAFGHLKRSCLDIFKLKVVEARDQYNALCALDTSAIDNGDFDRDLHRLFNSIRQGATEARQLEGETDDDHSVPAFPRWEAVYVQCVTLKDKFFLHDRLNWAKRRGLVAFIRSNTWGFIIGVSASLAAAVIYGILVRCP